jgi:hypothetical protein
MRRLVPRPIIQCVQGSAIRQKSLSAHSQGLPRLHLQFLSQFLCHVTSSWLSSPTVHTWKAHRDMEPEQIAGFKNQGAREVVTGTGVSCGASFSYARVIDKLLILEIMLSYFETRSLLDWLPNQGIGREPYRRWQPTAPGSNPRSVGLPGRTGMTPARRPGCSQRPLISVLLAREAGGSVLSSGAAETPYAASSSPQGEGIACRLWGWVRNVCTILQSEALTR